MQITDLPPFIDLESYNKYKGEMTAKCEIAYRHTVMIPTSDGLKPYMVRELTDEELHDMMVLLTDAPTK